MLRVLWPQRFPPHLPLFLSATHKYSLEEEAEIVDEIMSHYNSVAPALNTLILQTRILTCIGGMKSYLDEGRRVVAAASY